MLYTIVLCTLVYYATYSSRSPPHLSIRIYLHLYLGFVDTVSSFLSGVYDFAVRFVRCRDTRIVTRTTRCRTRMNRA